MIGITEMVFFIGSLVAKYSGYAIVNRVKSAYNAGKSAYEVSKVVDKMLDNEKSDSSKNGKKDKQEVIEELAALRKQDDHEVRKYLVKELKKAVPHLNNIMEHCYNKNDTKGCEAAKKVIEEINLFNSEADIAPVPKEHSFFTRGKIEERVLEKIIEYDYELIKKAQTITEAAERLSKDLAAQEEIDVGFEMNSLKNYVIDMRTKLKDRSDEIRKIN